MLLSPERTVLREGESRTLSEERRREETDVELVSDFFEARAGMDRGRSGEFHSEWALMETEG